ncbi:hypothetical protein HDU86_000031 [Geranomyces michiganensis]|nr:hypothetical protein HDU86_000031 [Geranomyces michiganensis]
MVQQRQALKRMFLQAYLHARFLPETRVKLLLADLCQHLELDANESIASFISEMNQTLDTYDMELRCAHAPDTGTAYYALVNTNGDEVAQVATECSAVEIAYFKSLLELIMHADSDVYEVSSMEALAMASRIKPAFTKRDAEAFIERLVNGNWLVDRNGLISMSLRTLLELQTYLKQEYPDRVHECTMCMEIVTSDYERCDTANCQTRLHAFCANGYFARREAHKLCPTCQRPWKGVLLGTGRPAPGGGNSGGSRLKRARLSAAASGSRAASPQEQDNMDEDGDEDDEPDAEGPVQHVGGKEVEMKEEADEADEEEEEEEEEDEPVMPFSRQTA